jgi:hypothetical protein
MAQKSTLVDGIFCPDKKDSYCRHYSDVPARQYARILTGSAPLRLAIPMKQRKAGARIVGECARSDARAFGGKMRHPAHPIGRARS